MKTFLSILLTGASVAVLIFGQFHWNEKTTVGNSDNPDHTTNKSSKETAATESIDTYLSYTNNWPADSVTTFKKKLEEKKPFKIALLGSNAQGDGTSSWPELVKDKVAGTFGNHIEVSTFSYDVNSLEYINQNLADEVTAVSPDLILFEPFTLNDNGNVEMEDSLANISTIMDTVKKVQPETVFLLQPPHPIYNATFYPMQVKELKEYAETNGITFLNHWEAWPDSSTEEIINYLVEDQSQPNEKGHEVWAAFVTDFLISN